jgi:hypothetical protein
MDGHGNKCTALQASRQQGNRLIGQASLLWCWLSPLRLCHQVRVDLGYYLFAQRQFLPLFLLLRFAT